MKTKILISIVVILFFVMLAFIAGKHFVRGEPLYIAVAGPMGTSNGEAMRQGISMYIEKVNQEGGIAGKKVKLLKFDDENKKKKAEEQALNIVNSQALAVIGHYASTPSIAAASIYKKHGIAAITGTATANEITENNEWFFRVIFTNRDQSAVIANYARKILGYKKAYILFDEDDYGKTLASAFEQTAKRIGLEIEHQWSFNRESFDNNFAQMVGQLADEDEYGILFLATHSTEALKTITGLRRLERKVPIIGADALASSYFMRTFKEKYPQEKHFPGYFTDGIHLASPFLIEIAGQRAQNFQYDFKKKKYPKESITTSAMYYDATMVALQAVRKTLEEDGENGSLTEKRERVKDNLWHLSKIANAVEGITGDLYFDKNGDAIKSVPIAVFKKGKPIVTMEQYQPLTNLQNIDNLLQEVLDNEIIQVNDKFMHKANVVYVGVDFNDISELNTANSTYTADFYIWFRYKDNKNEETKDFDRVNFVNIFDPDDDLDHEKHFFKEGKSSLEPGIVIKTYRIKTQFKGTFDFHDYPLDKQVLPLKFQHKKLTKDQLIYVVDIRGMRRTDTDNVLAKNIFSISGWKMNSIWFFQSSQKNDSTLGMPDLFDSEQRIEYSQFNVTVNIARHVLTFVIKNLLPTIFIILLGYVVYFTPSFGLRMSLNINMILATSLFHLQLSSSLSAIEYTVLIEYVFYMVYLLAVVGIVLSLFIYTREEELTAAQGSLEKLKEAKEAKKKKEFKRREDMDIGEVEDSGEGEDFGEDEGAESDDEKSERLEEIIKKEQLLIKRIVRVGRYGYPLVAVLTLIVISHSQWLPYFMVFSEITY